LALGTSGQGVSPATASLADDGAQRVAMVRRQTVLRARTGGWPFYRQSPPRLEARRDKGGSGRTGRVRRVGRRSAGGAGRARRGTGRANDMRRRDLQGALVRALPRHAWPQGAWLDRGLNAEERRIDTWHSRAWALGATSRCDAKPISPGTV
jgi:hypothetical protein